MPLVVYCKSVSGATIIQGVIGLRGVIGLLGLRGVIGVSEGVCGCNGVEEARILLQ
jgi:hypothetical protein